VDDEWSKFKSNEELRIGGWGQMLQRWFIFMHLGDGNLI
jgi:hypothetical protein